MTENTEWFSRYKFCQPLGQGGMGTVYLAEDRQQDNLRCVIKQLTNKYSDPHEHSEAVRLFQREATILGRLHHAGIVRIFDYHATEDGRYFLVMDYVPGKNLEVMLNTGGPFGADFTVQLAIQCCEVLEYLHSQQPPVLYRDLKPSNLMLTPDGRIVFVDFGIARSFMPQQAATRVVTAGYSPPEQYFGKPETRSDLYSLGATMSHLLTGKRPKPLTTCTPRLTVANVPLALDDLVRRLTSQILDERPSTAMAVRFELYKQYKQMYPEFDIPEEARAFERQSALLSASLTDEPDRGRAYVKAKFGHYESKSKEEVKVQAERGAKMSGRYATVEQQMPWWQKIKQWLEIWMS